MAPGYAWSFPLPGGTANVGYGVVRRPGQPSVPATLKGQRIDLLARPHIAEVLGPDATPDGPVEGPGPYPPASAPTPSAGLGGRVLFAGDAARACDPMTGEGIAQALETAELAARADLRAGPERPEAAAARYRRQIRWGMAVDDRLARDLSRVLAHPRGSVGALRIADSAAWCPAHLRPLDVRGLSSCHPGHPAPLAPPPLPAPGRLPYGIRVKMHRTSAAGFPRYLPAWLDADGVP